LGQHRASLLEPLQRLLQHGQRKSISLQKISEKVVINMLYMGLIQTIQAKVQVNSSSPVSLRATTVKDHLPKASPAT